MTVEKKAKTEKLVWSVLFVLYLILLLDLTVYRHRFDMSIFTSGELFQNGKLFLVPFVHMKWAYSDYPPYFIMSLLENLVMFVPVGICLRRIYGERMTLTKIVVISFAISFAIEFLQYMFGTGESETDDLLINTFSAFLGGGICILTEKYLNNKGKQDDSKGKGNTDRGK
ncbi:MAG: VanZ family protein [Clostridia bacterium]|nr:VanZ family protein [Clostridia bacterium]